MNDVCKFAVALFVMVSCIFFTNARASGSDVVDIYHTFWDSEPREREDFQAFVDQLSEREQLELIPYLKTILLDTDQPSVSYKTRPIRILAVFSIFSHFKTVYNQSVDILVEIFRNPSLITVSMRTIDAGDITYHMKIIDAFGELGITNDDERIIRCLVDATRYEFWLFEALPHDGQLWTYAGMDDLIRTAVGVLYFLQQYPIAAERIEEIRQLDDEGPFDRIIRGLVSHYDRGFLPHSVLIVLRQRTYGKPFYIHPGLEVYLAPVSAWELHEPSFN